MNRRRTRGQGEAAKAARCDFDPPLKQTYREIYESEGKKKLKEEIVQRANQSLAGFQVKAVYFTEFVIQ